MYEQKRSRYGCVSSKNISVGRGLKTTLFIAMYYVDLNKYRGKCESGYYSLIGLHYNQTSQ